MKIQVLFSLEPLLWKKWLKNNYFESYQTILRPRFYQVVRYGTVRHFHYEMDSLCWTEPYHFKTLLVVRP